MSIFAKNQHEKIRNVEVLILHGCIHKVVILWQFGSQISRCAHEWHDKGLRKKGRFDSFFVHADNRKPSAMSNSWYFIYSVFFSFHLRKCVNVQFIKKSMVDSWIDIDECSTVNVLFVCLHMVNKLCSWQSIIFGI